MHIQHFPATAESAGNLVLLHGWAMHSGIWAPVMTQLRERFDLWCVDLPGHGQARDMDWPDDAPALDQVSVIAEQTPAASIWLGWSMGGLFALEAARRGWCRALVLTACNPCFIQQPHWPDAMPDTVFQQFADDLASDYHRALRRFLALEVHGSERAREQLLTLQQIAFEHGTPSLSALRGGLQLLRQTDFSRDLPKLDLPALIIGGRRDRLVPRAGLQQTAQTMPNAQLKRIPGAGHAPFIGAPDGFADAVLTFTDAL